MRKKLLVGIFSLFFWVQGSSIAVADPFGGDVVVLGQILANALQQLAQLQQILGTGKDSLQLMEDINRGLRDAMALSQTMNSTLSPGTMSDLNGVSDAMRRVEELYGLIPRGPEAPLQKTTDQTVAEAFTMHNEAFLYADRVDPEAERIKDYAKMTNPLGSQRLTAQSIGVLINVMNQILRTNAALLKLQGEELALKNRERKLSSEQFRRQYEELSSGLSKPAPSYDLPRVY